jgi:hypothetical protein
MDASVTFSAECFVAMMCAMSTRLRSESDESTDGNVRERMREPRGDEVVEYAEEKRPEQSSPQVVRRYASWDGLVEIR